MGALSDFLRGAAGEVYNQSAQRRQMEQQTQAEDDRMRRQLKFAEAAERRRRLGANQDRAAELNAQGLQAGIDESGRQALYRVTADVDPNTAGLSTRRERVGDAPVTPVGRPFTVYDGANKRSVQRYSDGTEKDLGDPSPIREENAGSSVPRDAEGLTPYQRMQLEETRKNRERLERQSGKGGERPDNVRKAWDEEASRVSQMEGEALRSKARQYGMDQRGLPTDDETLKSALLAQVDAEYGKRLESARSRKPAGQEAPTRSSAQPDQQDAIRQAKAAIAAGAPRDAVIERLRKLGIEASL